MQDWSNQVLGLFSINWTLIKEYIVSLISTALITYVVIRIIRMILHQFFKRTTLLDEKKENTIESVFRNTTNYILFIVVLVAAIKPFVGDLKGFVAAGGIIAAVIGFGAQKVINDIISGVFIIFERTIQKGDFININEELEGGTVEELGFRIVKIRLINGKLVTVSNGEIRKLVNGSVHMRRVFESVIVSFNEDPSRMKEILLGVCEELNVRHKEYLLVDKYSGEFIEPYRFYGLHSLDVSPIGYKFSITATVSDTDYLKTAQETKELLAQKMFDHRVQMPAQQIVLSKSRGNT